MLTRLATHRGGRVIATVSKGHKAQPALDAGAWQVLVREEIDDLDAAIRELTDGTGVDIAFDGTGKTLFDTSVRAVGATSPGTFRPHPWRCSRAVDRSVAPARVAGDALD
jgi:NADPH:quinone reductase-like Zn-dependent oxidoreductase